VDYVVELVPRFVADLWDVLTAMSPYLLFGFVVAGVLSVVISPETVERHLAGRGMWPVVKAAVLGVPLPLCSCGVIPVGTSLRRHGASRGASVSFLISTPQTGVDSIFVTFSLLGPVFAVVRPVAAFVTGLVGGGLVDEFAAGGPNAADVAPACTAECCTEDGDTSKLVRALRYGLVTLPRDIVKPLIVGLMIAAFISAVVPEDYFAGLLGGGIVAMVVMMALGVPVYVCATASVPIAAALVAKGASPGAALVFLMTGPATNAATLATIWKVLGRRTALIYLGTVALGALAFGLALDQLMFGLAARVPAEAGWMLPGAIKWASAVFLFAVLAYALLSRGKAEAHAQKEDGETKEWVELRVDGMTCSHCAQSVTQALLGAKGVVSADVNLKIKQVVVMGHALDRAALRQAVEDLGYRVKEPEKA